MIDFLESFTYGGRWGIFGNLLEIAILSALIYAVVYYLRGTRGAVLARGLIIFYTIIVIVVLFIAKILDFLVLSTIIESLVGISLLGALVLFQPEIRRGLITLGEGAIHFFSGEIMSIEKEIVEAVYAIARRDGVGALIVIERKTQIGNYIESGIELDALISSPLVRTIFSKNTPLHDGAVIIRQGRIAAANCLLPLSENVEACRGMGTRHRAALGLSEESDALVIVVSEETSNVSVAMLGEMERNIESDRLHEILSQEWLQKQAAQANIGKKEG